METEQCVILLRRHSNDETSRSTVKTLSDGAYDINSELMQSQLTCFACLDPD